MLGQKPRRLTGVALRWPTRDHKRVDLFFCDLVVTELFGHSGQVQSAEIPA